MQLRPKLLIPILSLAVAIAACGAAPTVTPTTAPPPPATATVAAVQPSVAPTKAAAAPAATATSAPVAPTATSAPAPTATKLAAAATPAAPVADTPDVIANAQRAVLKQKALRIRMTITSTPAGVPMNNVLEYVLPDRVHMTLSGMEMIIIKNVGFWQKIASGSWQALPAAAAGAATESVFAAIDPAQVDTMMQGMVFDKFKSLGTEALDGKPMRTYQYVTKTNMTGSTIETTQKIWIGVADGLPYKAESTSTDSATPGVTSQTTSVYEYDNSIKIEAPM